ncbi:MAG: hypothetical protein V4722_21170 [Bacteroidota bacterium]
MERIGTLIEKLTNQHESGADAQTLLMTLQMLQKELLLQNGHVKKNGKNGVSVFMPAQLDLRFANGETVTTVKPAVAPQKLVFELDPDVTEDPPAEKDQDLHELPTFTRQPEKVITVEKKELNQTVASEKQSFNEVFDVKAKSELGATLQQDAVKDLRKAISINDRYQFISHLFKGDESMYERSVRTINGFNILPEANFWIRRELAVKLSWRDDDHLVQQFNQLVSRRFM